MSFDGDDSPLFSGGRPGDTSRPDICALSLLSTLLEDLLRDSGGGGGWSRVIPGLDTKIFLGD
jgi:hypothetical protein